MSANPFYFRNADLTLTSRMFEKQPASGWNLWIDASGDKKHSVTGMKYLFIAEAPASDGEQNGRHRGIRVPVDNGKEVGKVEENNEFRWDQRLTINTGWR